eukprot:m.46382 g.46382  ORF g.46382 m.46382 type:complete len:259 (+) comp12243_c0_seq2:97-873(+)
MRSVSTSHRRSICAVVLAVLSYAQTCAGVSPFPLAFNAEDGGVCSLASVDSLQAVIAAPGRLYVLPEFNSSSASFVANRIKAPSCKALVGETNATVALNAVFTLNDSTTAIDLTLSFYGSITNNRVSSWYLETVEALIAWNNHVYSVNQTYSSARASSFESQDGYAVKCRANAPFYSPDSNGTGVTLINAYLQPFNVKANQTKPEPKRGERFELCQFQKDQQDHTLAIAIAGAVAALCVCALVVYVIRSRHKTPYTAL